MKFSIIIPVYNTAQYLKKCLDSVINQTYKNLEIIIVNDGSSDNSKELIEEYKNADRRIKAIHKENGGIGSAYKVAFDNITGDYVSFVDSDDYLDIHMYDIILEKIIQKHPDVLHFGRELRTIGETNIGVLNVKNEIYTEGLEFIIKEQFEIIKDPSLACRVFKKDLFKNLILFDQNIGIDEILLPQLLLNSKSVFHITDILYFVFVRSSSVSRSDYTVDKLEQYIKVHNFIISLLESNLNKCTHYGYIKYINLGIPLFDWLLKNSDMNTSKFIPIFRGVLVSNYYKLIVSKKVYQLKVEFRIKLFFLEKAYFLYPIIFNLFWVLNGIKNRFLLFKKL